MKIWERKEKNVCKAIVGNLDDKKKMKRIVNVRIEVLVLLESIALLQLLPGTLWPTLVGPVFGSNRSVWKLFVPDGNAWNKTNDYY